MTKKTADYTNYIMPTFKQISADGYGNPKLYKPFMYDFCRRALTPYGFKYNTLVSQYDDKVPNFRLPTVYLLSHYAYGINNLSQFGNSLDNVIFQSALTSYTHITKVTHGGKLSYKQLTKLIEPIYNEVHFLASHIAKTYKRV